MRNHVVSIIGALSLAAAAGVAFAASFSELDKNRDGFITQAEARGDQSVLAAFGRADKNRDGKLDPAEFTAIGAGSTQGSGTMKPGN